MTRSLRSMGLLLSGLVLAASGWAQTQASNPWVRATVPQQRATGLFVELQSPQGSRLIGGSSPLAGRVEIHEMRMEGEVISMQDIYTFDYRGGDGATGLLVPTGIRPTFVDALLARGLKLPASLLGATL